MNLQSVRWTGLWLRQALVKIGHFLSTPQTIQREEPKKKPTPRRACQKDLGLVPGKLPRVDAKVRYAPPDLNVVVDPIPASLTDPPLEAQS